MRSSSSSPQLAEILREIEACTHRATAVSLGLSTAELARRPAPESWSIVEILEHLSISSRSYLPVFDKAADEMRAKNLAGTGPYVLDWMGRFMVWMIEPPSRFRFRTPGGFVPVAVAEPEKSLATFVALQGELAKRVHALDGLPLDRLKIRSPFAERVRYNVWSALKLVTSHERRHLGQAENAKRAIQRQ